MIKGHYDEDHNLVTVEFEGIIDLAQAEAFYPEVRKIVPRHGRGFRMLTDFSKIQKIREEVNPAVKKAMDYINENGVTEIIRVVPTPDQDPGFNILSIFHYSKKVRIVTLTSRSEAENRLKKASR